MFELHAQDMGYGSHNERKPVIGLTGSDGDQNEKQCEGSHDQSPCLDWLKFSRERA
jgi:hypothetical protein